MAPYGSVVISYDPKVGAGRWIMSYAFAYEDEVLDNSFMASAKCACATPPVRQSIRVADRPC